MTFVLASQFYVYLSWVNACLCLKCESISKLFQSREGPIRGPLRDCCYAGAGSPGAGRGAGGWPWCWAGCWHLTGHQRRVNVSSGQHIVSCVSPLTTIAPLSSAHHTKITRLATLRRRFWLHTGRCWCWFCATLLHYQKVARDRSIYLHTSRIFRSRYFYVCLVSSTSL